MVCRLRLICGHAGCCMLPMLVILRKILMKRLSLALMLLLAAVDATAQSQEAGRAIRWHIDGGYSIMTGTLHDYLDNGYIISGGFTWRPAPGAPLALRVDAHYSGYNANNHLLDIAQEQTQTRIDDGTGSTLGVDVNAVSYLPISANASFYLTGGVGVDRRRIDVTQTVLYGDYFCDLWDEFCSFGVAPGDVLVARDSTTKFAWNAGVGIEFSRSIWGSWFIEATYHRIESSPSTSYIPIKVGLRF